MQPLEVSANTIQCEQNFLLNPLLFCDTGGIPYSSAFFGAGTGPIYLDDVICTSSASQLLECFSRPVSSYNCSHFADAGVGCEGDFSYFLNLKLHTKTSYQAVFPYFSSMLYWSTSTGWR